MEAIAWMPVIKGTRGTVLVAMGNTEEGILLLLEAMSQTESQNEQARSACHLAEAECRRGAHDEARNYLEEARKLDRNCPLLSRTETILREASASS